MKKIFFILILLFLFSCKSKVPKIEPETPKLETVRYTKEVISEFSVAKKNKAYSLGKRLLETCNTSKFIPFSTTEATEKVIKNATLEKISKTCQKFILRNGKFIDLNLIEIIRDAETDEYIFRYDIVYEKKYFKRELKVSLDNQDRVSAISTKELPSAFR